MASRYAALCRPPARRQVSFYIATATWRFWGCAASRGEAAPLFRCRISATLSSTRPVCTLIRRDQRSHIRIVRPAAALRRHPVDVLGGILDVAGLAVDAVLRVDHEARIALASVGVDHLVDAGRAIEPRGLAIERQVLARSECSGRRAADGRAGPPRDWCSTGTPRTAGRTSARRRAWDRRSAATSTAASSVA